MNMYVMHMHLHIHTLLLVKYLGINLVITLTFTHTHTLTDIIRITDDIKDKSLHRVYSTMLLSNHVITHRMLKKSTTKC